MIELSSEVKARSGGKVDNMFKNGFRFRITKNGYTGEITGVSANGIYSVMFYDTDGIIYLHTGVYEETIKGNLELGNYVAI